MTNNPSTFSLLKPDDELIEGIPGQFSPKAILFMDGDLPIEQGDRIIHILPSGLRVEFFVKDSGYREQVGSIPAHFEVQVFRAAPVDSLEQSDYWRRRSINFERLSRRQARLGIDREHSQWLSGFCSRLFDDEAGIGSYCSVEGGQYQEGELRSKFIEVSIQCGNALGCPAETDPAAFWVSCLCLDLLQEQRTRELLQSAPGGGLIVDLLSSSAAYCSRLAAMAGRKANNNRHIRPTTRESGATNAVAVTSPSHAERLASVNQQYGGGSLPTYTKFYEPIGAGVTASEFVAWKKQDHKHCGKRKRKALDAASDRLFEKL
jgi:hypothetical protein